MNSVCCSTEGCTNERHARGVCRTHYAALRRKQNPEKQREASLRWLAKPGNRERARAIQAPKRREKQTGMSPKMFAACMRQQGGGCALCGCRMQQTSRAGNDRACADHYETLDGVLCRTGTPGSTKHPRGVLCSGCNRALGVYEWHQRMHGLRIQPYEDYLQAPPVSGLT